ncbi:transketolase [Candidatus Babeliales bacterium]|nr:transketolase [Candidatus Babeliales bacterium]
MEKIETLKYRAAQLRIDSIMATTAAGSGHPTSCLSAADIVAALFFDVMNFDPQKYYEPETDRFILSKGHAAPLLYSVFKQLGVVVDQELLKLRDFDSPLEGHPTSRCPLVEVATGSLGQGLAAGVGMALSAKRRKQPFNTYVLLGDGELAEGSNWEAAGLAAQYNLDNLIGIADCNRLGQTGGVAFDHDVEKVAAKFEAFGWKIHCVDGHNLQELCNVLRQAKNNSQKPSMIIAKTFKGKGASSIEDKNGYHGKALSQEDAQKTIEEIKATITNFDGYKKSIPMPLNVTIPAKPEQKLDISICIDQSPDFVELEKEMATRKAFGIALRDLGHECKDVVVLDGDVGNSTFTQIFAEEFPDRFTQCFIAEQAMVGIATGMSTRGDIPFAASFGAFLTRAHDQIRMAGVGRNVLRLCGSHSGVSIGFDGPSQMGLEDLAMMRSVPNSVVLYPSDAVCAYKLVEKMVNYHDGISYMRTTRATTPVLYKALEEFEIGHFKLLRRSDSDRLVIISAGITLHESLKAYEMLKKTNVDVAVIDLYSIKPINKEALIEVVKACDRKVLTVEDHYAEGGLSEAVRSALAGQEVQVVSKAVEKLPRSGSPEALMKYACIDSDSICDHVRKILNLE